jgi:plastocyanin
MKRFTRLYLLFFIMLLSKIANAAIVTISVANNTFSPANVTINSGDVIQFQWVSGVHTATSDNGAWPSLNISSSTPTQTLTLGPGNYPYHCSFHGAPGGIGMSGNIVVRSVSGVKEIASPLLFKVYPNPSNGKLEITFKEKDSNNYKIQIADAVGNIVKIIDVNKNVEDSKIDLNISNLPSGLYFFNLITNNQMIETHRLLLQRE